jgi:3-deoxy-manno-octulosonate cytidylyltransferase (CMP-KDO synthetase)
MPNIDPSAIKLLDKFMNNNSYQIATLATELNSIKDLENKNIVKVETKKEMQRNSFDNALDFFRLKNINKGNFYYHHVGIYGYQYETLKKFISFKRSDNEINRSLEQMRAMDNDISISVGLTDSYPLGVDTIEDLEEIRNIMKNG